MKTLLFIILSSIYVYSDALNDHKIAQGFLEKKQFLKADSMYQIAQSKELDNFEWTLARARVANWSGNQEKALILLENCDESNPRVLENWKLCSELLMINGDSDKSLSLIQIKNKEGLNTALWSKRVYNQKSFVEFKSTYSREVENEKGINDAEVKTENLTGELIYKPRINKEINVSLHLLESFNEATYEPTKRLLTSDNNLGGYAKTSYEKKHFGTFLRLGVKKGIENRVGSLEYKEKWIPILGLRTQMMLSDLSLSVGYSNSSRIHKAYLDGEYFTGLDQNLDFYTSYQKSDFRWLNIWQFSFIEDDNRSLKVEQKLSYKFPTSWGFILIPLDLYYKSYDEEVLAYYTYDFLLKQKLSVEVLSEYSSMIFHAKLGLESSQKESFKLSGIKELEYGGAYFVDLSLAYVFESLFELSINSKAYQNSLDYFSWGVGINTKKWF